MKRSKFFMFLVGVNSFFATTDLLTGHPYWAAYSASVALLALYWSVKYGEQENAKKDQAS